MKATLPIFTLKIGRYTVSSSIVPHSFQRPFVGKWGGTEGTGKYFQWGRFLVGFFK